MSRNKIIYLIVVAVILIILVYSFSDSGGQDNYKEEILNRRAEIERFMRTSEESPFKSTGLTFNGLKYFEPDPAYRIMADFTPISNGEIRRLPTSDGKEELYREYGYADFTLDDRDHRLIILQNVDQENIFIPFADSTSGEETYGAGRYLEVPEIRKNKITLDFNYAYNPYCAYSPDYSCPLPPVENYLAVSIPAGEKNYDQ